MWLHAEIRSLGDIPRHYARVRPEAPALRDANGARSFLELDRESNRIANLLLSRGLTPGSRVAFLGKNSVRFFEVLFGTSKADLPMLPLNWRLAPVEIAAIMDDAMPTLLLVDRECTEMAVAALKSCHVECPMLVFDSTGCEASAFDDLLATADTTDPQLPINPWQTAVLMYTSGTTGVPKGVQLSHQGYLNLRLCEHLDPACSYRPDDVMLTVMPLFHAMGTGLSLQALYNGIPVAVYSMPDAGGLMKLIARERPTVVPLVPTVIQMLLDHPEAATADYSSVRIVVYAGASIGAHLLSRAMREMSCDFMQFYGATETSAGITLLRPSQHRLDQPETLKSCGTPLPQIEIRIVDAEGRELPNGEIGELLIRSPSLATGYFLQPEATAIAFGHGWYRSGDAGYRDAEGLIYLVDRVKDMIVTGGENVYSTEVEQALLKYAGVQMCAVVGLPDDKWGERVVGAIVTDRRDMSPQDIVRHCRELIAGYKVPKQLVFVEALPMTSTGKINKRALREQLMHNAVSLDAASPTATGSVR